MLKKSEIFLNVVQGLFIALGVFGSYYFLVGVGYGASLALTFSFTVLILSNLLVVYTNINEHNLAIRNMVVSLKDKAVFLINLFIFLGLMAIIYVPFIQDLVGTTALSFSWFVASLLIAMVVTLWYDLIKVIRSDK